MQPNKQLFWIILNSCFGLLCTFRYWCSFVTRECGFTPSQGLLFSMVLYDWTQLAVFAFSIITTHIGWAFAHPFFMPNGDFWVWVSAEWSVIMWAEAVPETDSQECGKISFSSQNALFEVYLPGPVTCDFCLIAKSYFEFVHDRNCWINLLKLGWLSCFTDPIRRRLMR